MITAPQSSQRQEGLFKFKANLVHIASPWPVTVTLRPYFQKQNQNEKYKNLQIHLLFFLSHYHFSIPTLLVAFFNALYTSWCPVAKGGRCCFQ